MNISINDIILFLSNNKISIDYSNKTTNDLGDKINIENSNGEKVRKETPNIINEKMTIDDNISKINNEKYIGDNKNNSSLKDFGINGTSLKDFGKSLKDFGTSLKDFGTSLKDSGINGTNTRTSENLLDYAINSDVIKYDLNGIMRAVLLLKNGKIFSDEYINVKKNSMENELFNNFYYYKNNKIFNNIKIMLMLNKNFINNEMLIFLSFYYVCNIIIFDGAIYRIYTSFEKIDLEMNNMFVYLKEDVFCVMKADVFKILNDGIFELYNVDYLLSKNIIKNDKKYLSFNRINILSDIVTKNCNIKKYVLFYNCCNYEKNIQLFISYINKKISSKQ